MFLSFRYGDVVPRSLVGRCITVIWMVAGLIIASLITATITEVMAGTSYLDLSKEQVRFLSFKKQHYFIYALAQ